MTTKSGIHDVSECSDSYDSEDSDNLRKRYRNHSFLDDEVDKAKTSLKFKNMAQYRALKEGETQVYVDIDNDLLDLAFKKGMACNNERVEKEERGVLKEIEHTKRVRHDRHYTGRRSSDSELLDSVRSSEDFWNEYGEEGLGTTMQRAKKSIERQRKKKEGLKKRGLRPKDNEQNTLNAKD